MRVVLSLVLFLSAVIMVISQTGHFFIILLSFEVLTLALFYGLGCVIFSFKGMSASFLLLIFLVFSVCEARLGLGLLVRSMRGQGFDFIKSSLRLKF